MANALFAAIKTSMYKADVDFDNNLKIFLGDAADDDPNVATDDFLDDITGAAIVATSGNLASKTFGVVAAGTFDAADVTFSSVTGDVSEYLVGYYDSGSAATSALIWKMDTGTGLPVTPNGGNITAQWNASGIITWSG